MVVGFVDLTQKAFCKMSRSLNPSGFFGILSQKASTSTTTDKAAALITFKGTHWSWQWHQEPLTSGSFPRISSDALSWKSAEGSQIPARPTS